MSIKGLTDRGLSFPEIGQIRKGAKKSPNAPGADLTYFRVEFDEIEKKAQQDFIAAYEDKPTAIKIILPFNELDRMWDAWMEAYTAGRMVARSDGEFIVYQQDDAGNTIVKNGFAADGKRVPHPANDIAGRDSKNRIVKFKPTGRLKVIIPELARAAYLTVMTTSIHDIQNISSQLAAFQALNNGQIAGIPLILRRRPKEISTPTPEGNRVRRKKWLISIEADPTWVKYQLSNLNRLALPEEQRNLLTAGNEVADELEHIDAEYDDDEIISQEGDQPEGVNNLVQTETPAPAVTPPAQSEILTVPIEEARAIKTPNGTEYGKLNDKQLIALSGYDLSPARRQAVNLILKTDFGIS